MKIKFLLLSFITVTGCINASAGNTGPAERGKPINEVAGNVIDGETKKPIRDVTVTAYLVSKKEKFVLTDESGKFDFDELKAGIYKIVFEKEGYRRIIKDRISIKADETFQMRIEMLEDYDYDLLPSPFHFIETK